MRFIEALRKFIGERLERQEYETDDEDTNMSGQENDQSEKFGVQSLYPVLKTEIGAWLWLTTSARGWGVNGMQKGLFFFSQQGLYNDSMGLLLALPSFLQLLSNGVQALLLISFGGWVIEFLQGCRLADLYHGNDPSATLLSALELFMFDDSIIRLCGW